MAEDVDAEAGGGAAEGAGIKIVANGKDKLEERGRREGEEGK